MVMNHSLITIRTALLATIMALVSLPACSPAGTSGKSDKLVVYCSVDEAFGRKVLDAYRARTGLPLAIIFDSEAGKTTGLVNRIVREAESGRPRGDVFWSSELFQTILLGRQGLLEPYEPSSAGDIPTRYRDAQHRWTALAARARVLAYDPRAVGSSPRGSSEIGTVSSSTVPMRWEQLAEPKFAAHLSIANPLFGTTRGHVAAMFALWGNQRGRKFLTALRNGGVRIVDGNSAAVRDVIAGRTKWAATDTDDVWLAQRSGASLDLVYPDMGDGGTLLVPCSVAIIHGTQHGKEARQLVDYLVSAEVERMMAESDSRNVPVRAALRRELGIAWPPESKVTFDAVADAMDEAAAAVREILIR